MTFLQPFILWGLPLILVPVIIHLINRMRHRRQPWAAMQFLLSASRASVSHAKLRQFLVLLFRVLAVLALILFLSRPIAGGWLGWAMSPAPDAVLLLLDRSASMETQIPGTTTTRREQALELFAQAAKEFEHSSHLILIESALREPQQISSAAHLRDISLTAPTDTAADIPAMLHTALNWLIDNRAGTAEIWIASDLQRSNWHPDDPRLEKVLEQLASLPQKVRVRLLALNQEATANVSVAIHELSRRQRGGESELRFVLDFRQGRDGAEQFPLTVELNGARSQTEITMDGPALRWRHRMELNGHENAGWGSFEIPADANRHDNKAYFVYGAETALRAAVVSEDSESGRFLQLAAAASTRGGRGSVRHFSPGESEAVDLGNSALLIWQAALPTGPLAQRIRKFVEDGGVVIFFPGGEVDSNQFNGIGWGEVKLSEPEQPFRVLRWDEEQGPLARTDEGFSLPLGEGEFLQRRDVGGAEHVLASFSDGAPFLARRAIGRGEIYFCATLPNYQWSNLADGPVLVPMIQRLMQDGSRRLQAVSTIHSGELSVADQMRQWTAVDSSTPKDIRTAAGVYRSGERLIAVNRPPAEDDPENLGMDEAHAIFAGLPFQMLQDRQVKNEQLQAELWRLLLFGMLLFLLAEGVLILPGRPADGSQAVATNPKPAEARA